jgi:hypothetical protein
MDISYVLEMDITCIQLRLYSSSLALGRLFCFLIYTRSAGLLGRGMGSARRKASTYTHKATQTQNEPTQTSMHRVGFESTIPVFKWAKTVHALDRAATVTG